MLNKIRKISVGSNYKEGGMHFYIGQHLNVGSVIDIEEVEAAYIVYLYRSLKQRRIVWKQFNKTMPICLEYDIFSLSSPNPKKLSPQV